MNGFKPKKYDRTMRIKIGSSLYQNQYTKLAKNQTTSIDGEQHRIIGAERLEGSTDMMVFYYEKSVPKGVTF